MPEPIKLSPSSLNLMEECPRCFWLKVRKKITRPQMPVASIVIKMDSIIKHYFEGYRESGQLPDLIKDKITAKLARGMPHTLQHTDAGTGIIIRGIPDEYLELPDRSIIPLDHKTKSKPPEEIHRAHQLQLDVYSYLLQKNGYQTKEKGYLAYYYPEKCQLHQGMDIKVVLLPVKTSIMRVEHLITKADAILKGKLPERNKGCTFCTWNS
ncbi:PD-(D/E)XK nuclease family protein [Candidatus Woesearchaeota archaeon]|nr:PD-(D/E)XK nuclease family protein [Candidatus Woesearchaeota archaeon]